MKQLLFVFIIGGFLVGCANIIPPTGGLKDSSPPIVETTYPEKNQTSYQGYTIKISFDEHIKLIDINEAFYASPPLMATPNFSSKNKTVSIDWQGQLLKDNTTYLFHLGNSITDYNEGNVLSNYSLQFSTGKTADTLCLSGSIIDALSKKPEKDVFALLYIYSVSNSDSIFYLEHPNYIAKTDENGDFHFPNLKDEQYVLFALADEDRNLNFSLAEELVGFHPQPIAAGNQSVILRMFSELVAADTMSNLAIDSLTKYGNLIIDSLPNSHHILELLKDKKIVKRLPTSTRILVDSLPIGNYQIRLISDENQNGIWDTGNILEKRQPEVITYYPEEVHLRANWDSELIWKE